MPSNIGTQTVTVKYYDPVDSAVANRIALDIRKVGIYSGAYLTKVNDTTVTLSTFSAEIPDYGATVNQIRCSTAATLNVTVGAATPYVVLRWTYTGSASVDYVDFVAVAVGNILSTDVVVGLCNFSGATLTGFSYTLRTNPNVFDLYGKVEPTVAASMYVRIRNCKVSYGTQTYTVVDQLSPLFTAPVSGSRIDVLYVDNDGVVKVYTGTPGANPSAPVYQQKVVLAEITIASGASSIVAANIQNVASLLYSKETATTQKTLMWFIPSTAIVGTNISARIKLNYPITITKAKAYAKTAPTGANLILDIKVAGTSIWGSNPSNRLKITAGNNEDTDTTTFDTTAVSADQALTLDIVQVGSTIPGSDLTVELEVTS